MNTVKFTILIDAIDCYIYSGHLFFVLKSGELSYTSVSTIVHKLIEKYPDYNNLIRLAFQRNDYFSNNQGKIFFGIPELKSTFIKAWSNATSKIHFIIDGNEIDLTVITEIPSMPVLDMKLYAMKLFVGSKKGLYQINLNSDDRYHFNPSKSQRIFDAKVTCLNAKSGKVVISSNTDGLFHGDIFATSEVAKVNDRAVASKSLRTGWSYYDVINYEENNNLHYYVNKVQAVSSKLRYSKFDEASERKTITEFGVVQYELSRLLERTGILPDEINYCFNSSSSCFFLLKDGRFVTANLRKEEERSVNQENKEVYLSSTVFELPRNNEDKLISKRPISSSIVPKGCVIEYFDKVVLYQNGKAKLIETEPTISVRTYPSSLRYRNLITITKMEEVTIHSIFPFENEITSDVLSVDEVFS